jgi:hypothetical protein
MKTLRCCVFSCLAIFAIVSPSSAENNRRDGNWWVGEGKVAHIDYIIGFFDGVDLGGQFSYWDLIKAKAASAPCFDKATSSFEHYNKYFDNVTSGQLADALDVFYADALNRRIRLPQAVWLVLNGISGMPQEELTKMIESFRRNAGQE